MSVTQNRMLTTSAFALVAVVAALTCSAAAAATESNDKAHLIEARASQSKIDELTSKMMEEMSRLESETHKEKIPILATRNNVLKSIKGFWGRVMEAHPSHINWIRGNDREILPYLRDLVVEDIHGDGSDHHMHQYRIKLEFAPNPFFSDSILWREIRGAIEDTQKASGVHWMPGKEPREPSFFSFFEDSEQQQQRRRLDLHIMSDIAHVIRYEFWPNPFTYHDLPTYHDYINQDAGTYMSEEHTHEYPPPESDELPAESDDVKDDM